MPPARKCPLRQQLRLVNRSSTAAHRLVASCFPRALWHADRRKEEIGPLSRRQMRAEGLEHRGVWITPPRAALRSPVAEMRIHW